MLRRLALVLTALVACVNEPALAGSFNISPIVVNLSADGSPETIRVQNLESQPVLIHVEARAWAEQIDEAEKTLSILAVPPVVEVAANGDQVVRLAVRQSSASRQEQAYRLVISEVPRSVAQGENALSFALRFVLPVFVTPEGAAPAPNWTLTTGSDGTAELVVVNQGTAHVRLKELTLGGSSLAEGSTYVLAGETKSWPLDQPLSALPDVLEIRAETNRGPLVAEVRPRAS